MMTTRRLVCLVSPDSLVYSRELIEAYGLWAQDNGAQLHCVVIDLPNRHNLRVLEDVPLSKAVVVARERGQAQIHQLVSDGVIGSTWGDVLVCPNYRHWLKIVDESFRDLPSFRRHCLNETFSKLQPKFRRIGISNKRHPLVAICTRFLIEEIAFKVAAFTDPDCLGEIMPHSESLLLSRIYSGHYFPCERLGEPYRIVFRDATGNTSIQIVSKEEVRAT